MKMLLSYVQEPGRRMLNWFIDRIHRTLEGDAGNENVNK